jgi:hypothetical protein
LKNARLLQYVGIGIIAIGIPLAVLKVLSRVSQKSLIISVGEGGTTDPAPGVYTRSSGENVTIQAIPNTDYTVGKWVLDGVEVASEVNSYTVTMNQDHTLIVTFWYQGIPPPTYPQAIISTGSVSLISNYLVEHDGIVGCVKIHTADDNWTLDQMIKKPMSFKVIDAAGQGVPSIDVAFWADIPDMSRYSGMTLLDELAYIITNPLILKTDVNGIVSPNVSYLYGKGDQFRLICSDAGIAGWILSPLGIPIPTGSLWDGACPCMGILPWVSVSGEGISGQNLPSAYPNRVNAQVVGTTLITAELMYGGFHIKWG